MNDDSELKPLLSAESLARRFHELYEQEAQKHGYETREDTRDFDPESSNGWLMISVCRKVLAELGS